MKNVFAFVLRYHSRYSNEMSELDLTKFKQIAVRAWKNSKFNTNLWENSAYKNAGKKESVCDMTQLCGASPFISNLYFY